MRAVCEYLAAIRMHVFMHMQVQLNGFKVQVTWAMPPRTVAPAATQSLPRVVVTK